MKRNGWTLRQLYRTLELPGDNPARTAQEDLDEEVEGAYGKTANYEALEFLLKVNQTVAKREEAGQPVVGPGVPPTFTDIASIVTTDCVKI